MWWKVSGYSLAEDEGLWATAAEAWRWDGVLVVAGEVRGREYRLRVGGGGVG